MSNKILELADKAYGENWKTIGHASIPDQFCHAFAELIVKECIDVLMKPEYAMTHPNELSQYNKGWVNGRLLAVEQIKHRLGIQE